MRTMRALGLVSLTVLLAGTMICRADSTSSPQAEENVPALKDAFKDIFLTGAALHENIFTGKDPNAAAIVIKHFNAITPEDVMKWDAIHPAPNKYNFDPADKYVEFGEKNNMFIVGHTLVWHDQTPRWVFKGEDGNQISRDALLARMKEHIQTVVGRYKGRVKGWDVVNEALDPNNGELRKSKWLEIIGEDYIAKAFEYAHETDPAAELYYNDYSIENPAKRDGCIKLVKQLKEKGVPITAVGIQGQGWRVDRHYPLVSDVEALINGISALGVKTMITEMTIDVLPNATSFEGADIRLNVKLEKKLNPYPDGQPEGSQRGLATRYAELFSLFVKHRKDIRRVTLWGVYDGHNWLNDWPVKGRTSYPLLFDRQYQPKPAFFAVLKTATDPNNLATEGK
ncbi:MAG: endo-1,4-beta-xylanase [Sedimentisphaerales bacterium]